MIKVEFTPTGWDTLYLALFDYDDDIRQWFGWLKSISSFKFQCSSKHGGYAKPASADIYISWDAFSIEEDWPPPAMAEIKIMDDDELIFAGSAMKAEYNRFGIRYVPRKPEIDVVVPAGTYTGTLVSVITTLCGLISRTLDSDLAENPSPAVNFTLDNSDTLAIDLLDEMCGWFCHAYKLTDTELILVDLKNILEDLSDDPYPISWDLDEDSFQDIEYRGDIPTSLIQSGDETLEGTYSNGEKYTLNKNFHDTSANIQTILEGIRGIMDLEYITISCKKDQANLRVLEKVRIYDETSLAFPITSIGIVTTVNYDQDNEMIEAELIGRVGI